MNLATVIGELWATRRSPGLENTTLRWIQPEDAARRPLGDPVVAVDTVGAAPGEQVFYVTAREAVLPLAADEAPVDASIVGIVEGISTRDAP